MRRITIYADEDTAKKAVAWLEDNGLDFMSEDYASPDLQHRSPPIRRAAPERHEPTGGFLPPTLKPSLNKGQMTANVLQDIKRSPGILLIELMRIYDGATRKQIRDTLNRLQRQRKIHRLGDGYAASKTLVVGR